MKFYCRIFIIVDLLLGLLNIALGKTAIQSSTLASLKAELAVDGNSDSSVGNNHCSHTGDKDLKPWWAVDLAARYSVTEVKLVLRGDCCGQLVPH